MEHQNVGIM